MTMERLEFFFAQLLRSLQLSLLEVSLQNLLVEACEALHNCVSRARDEASSLKVEEDLGRFPRDLAVD